MKKIITLSVLIALAISANAQIPNSGFENWSTTGGGYSIPDGWQTSRDTVAGSFRPTSRDTSHYPASVGSYSIRLENKPSLLPSYSALAIAETGNIIGAAPAFAITGHPSSLKGYYKYAPQNGDTLWIAVVLTKGDSIVCFGQMTSAVSASNWTSFTIPLPTYTVADSAFIILSAYLANSPTQVPHGNSVLNVDNLSFDTLITGIAENNELSSIAVYPNPTSGQFIVILPTDNGTITVTDILGQQILQTPATQKNMTLQLDKSGIYLVYVKTKEGTTTRKLMVNR